MIGLYELCSDTLSNYGENDLMRPEPHAEMCDFIEANMPIHEKRDTQSKAILLVPRRCFKTSIGTVGSVVKYLTHNPDGRVLIYAHTHGYAKEILGEIKGHLEANEKFRNLFGDWVPKGRGAGVKWNEESIIITRRKKSLKEPSIDTAGVDKPKTGGHYDYIVCDDIVTETSIDSSKIQKKIRQQVQTLYPICEPGGSILFIGTRWAHNDVYGWLIKRDQDLQREENLKAEREGRAPRTVAEYKKLIRKAYNPDGSLYFPESLSQEFLEEQRSKLEDRMFANWYLNEPIEEGSKVFHRAHMKFYRGEFVIDRAPFIEALVAA